MMLVPRAVGSLGGGGAFMRNLGAVHIATLHLPRFLAHQMRERASAKNAVGVLAAYRAGLRVIIPCKSAVEFHRSTRHAMNAINAITMMAYAMQTSKMRRLAISDIASLYRCSADGFHENSFAALSESKSLLGKNLSLISWSV